MNAPNENVSTRQRPPLIPLYKNWLFWATLSPVICFATFVILQFVIHEPASQQAQSELQSEFGRFSVPPQSIQQRVDVSRKPGTDMVRVEGAYTTGLGSGDVRAFYDREFSRNAWAPLAEKNSGAGSAQFYCKGNYTAVVTYLGQGYTLDFSQGYYRDCAAGKMPLVDALSILLFSVPATVAGIFLGWQTVRYPDLLDVRFGKRWTRSAPLTRWAAFGLSIFGMIASAAALYNLWLYAGQK